MASKDADPPLYTLPNTVLLIIEKLGRNDTDTDTESDASAVSQLLLVSSLHWEPEQSSMCLDHLLIAVTGNKKAASFG